jgi:hypothetical protein
MERREESKGDGSERVGLKRTREGGAGWDGSSAFGGIVFLSRRCERQPSNQRCRPVRVEGWGWGTVTTEGSGTGGRGQAEIGWAEWLAGFYEPGDADNGKFVIWYNAFLAVVRKCGRETQTKAQTPGDGRGGEREGEGVRRMVLSLGLYAWGSLAISITRQ